MAALITIAGVLASAYEHAKSVGTGVVPSLRIVLPNEDGTPSAKGEFVLAWGARMDNLVPDTTKTKADGTEYVQKAHFATVRWSENNTTTVLRKGDHVEFALQVSVYNGKPSLKAVSLVNHIPANPASTDTTPEVKAPEMTGAF